MLNNFCYTILYRYERGISLMADRGACPILSANNEVENWECMRDACMWYIYGKCAINIIAEALDKTDESGHLIRD